MGTEKRERQKQGRQARLEAARAAQVRQQRRSRRITFTVIAVVMVGGLFAWSTFMGGDGNESADSTTTTTAPAGFRYGDGECAPETLPAEPVLDFSDAPQSCIDPTQQYTAVFDTSEGEITVALDTTNTPGTVNNFVNLAKFGYYDGTKIFRTDTSIEIIQGGSPHTQDNSDPGPGYNISDEGSGYTYEPGQLVMARSSGPDSASAQFFFVSGAAASNLDADGSYVVFGQADAPGLEVIQAILALNVDDPNSQLGGAPSRDVTINSVTIEETAGTGEAVLTDTSVPATTTSAP